MSDTATTTAPTPWNAGDVARPAPRTFRWGRLLPFVGPEHCVLELELADAARSGEPADRVVDGPSRVA